MAYKEIPVSNWEERIRLAKRICDEAHPLPPSSHVSVADEDLPDRLLTPMGIRLEKLFNSILQLSETSSELLEGYIVSLIKDANGDLASMDNRRGITVSNEEIKLLFGLLARRISNKLEEREWFVKDQSGFREGLESIG